MNVNVLTEQGRVPVTVLRVEGDIDSNTYEAFEKQGRQAIQAGARHVLVDLSKVSYVSSAGVRALTALFQALRAAAPDAEPADLQKGLRDGTYRAPHFKLLNPSKEVDYVLKTTGLDMFLDIFKDYQTAITSF